MTLEEMREKKREYGLTNEQISTYTGVPLATVQKIFAGVTESPRYTTMQALETVFRSVEREGEERSPRPDRTAESLAYMANDPKVQGEYTLADYYALPDDRRVELIDGVIYDMSSPESIHQILITEIWSQLRSYIDRKKGACLPMTAPLDVQLDRDDRTMVQPDVLVVCDRSKVVRRCVYGAPDFVVEILSPSTWEKDMYVKLGKYESAGVREYWIVDPKKKRVLVYDFEHTDFPALYTFTDQIPVGIFDGECRVDFASIYEYVRFLYEREDSEREGSEREDDEREKREDED
ncbi:Uma2 family endonuclease [uncultured Merdimonas sp.]|uniref:Uma2 family endonuclease n=1 Tax=uncultured Merdimonas sp. TaxID=2023269 RepID=UPI003207D43C